MKVCDFPWMRDLSTLPFLTLSCEFRFEQCWTWLSHFIPTMCVLRRARAFRTTMVSFHNGCSNIRFAKIAQYTHMWMRGNCCAGRPIARKKILGTIYPTISHLSLLPTPLVDLLLNLHPVLPTWWGSCALVSASFLWDGLDRCAKTVCIPSCLPPRTFRPREQH